MSATPPPLPLPTGGTPQDGQLPHGFVRGFDRILAVHRPAVLAHIRAIRRHNPQATPEAIIRVLERRYLTATTMGAPPSARRPSFPVSVPASPWRSPAWRRPDFSRPQPCSRSP